MRYPGSSRSLAAGSAWQTARAHPQSHPETKQTPFTTARRPLHPSPLRFPAGRTAISISSKLGILPASPPCSHLQGMLCRKSPGSCRSQGAGSAWRKPHVLPHPTHKTHNPQPHGTPFTHQPSQLLPNEFVCTPAPCCSRLRGTLCLKSPGSCRSQVAGSAWRKRRSRRCGRGTCSWWGSMPLCPCSRCRVRRSRRRLGRKTWGKGDRQIEDGVWGRGGGRGRGGGAACLGAHAAAAGTDEVR